MAHNAVSIQIQVHQIFLNCERSQWSSWGFMDLLTCVRAKPLQSWPPLWGPMDGIAHQAPQSMGFSRQERWSGFLCPPPRWTLESDLNSSLDSPIDPLAVQTLGKLLNSLFPVIFFACLGGLFVRFKFSDGLNKVVELSAPWQSPERAPEPQALFS